MHASLLKNAILFARMTKHAAASNDLVCYIVGRDFPVTRQCFFDPLHSHLPDCVILSTQLVELITITV
jgi:hypothetical protein